MLHNPCIFGEKVPNLFHAKTTNGFGSFPTKEPTITICAQKIISPFQLLFFREPIIDQKLSIFTELIVNWIGKLFGFYSNWPSLVAKSSHVDRKKGVV